MRTWVKLYTEILRDPKMHNLSDHSFRACVNLIALAGQLDENGRLGTDADMAFHLRLEAVKAFELLSELEKISVTCNKKGVWWLKNWRKRNGKPLSETREAVRDRVRKHRENKPIQEEVKRESNEPVTSLHDGGNAPRLDKNREDKNREDKNTSGAKNAPDEPDALKALSVVFEQASGIHLASIPKRRQGPLYWHPLRLMLQTANGAAPDEVRAAVNHLRKSGLTISDPNSILKTFNSIHGERSSAPVVKPFEMSPEQIAQRDQLREFNKQHANPG